MSQSFMLVILIDYLLIGAYLFVICGRNHASDPEESQQ